MPIFEGMRKFPHRSSVLDNQVKLRVLQTEMSRFDRRNSGVAAFRRVVVRHGISYLEYAYLLEDVLRQVGSYRKSQKGDWRESARVIRERLRREATRVKVRPGAIAPTH